MSREIKFRGQTYRKGEYRYNVPGDKDDSNWVFGVVFPQIDGVDFALIYQQKDELKHLVYADTVGQYVGIKDKNGTEIFEKDIVVIDGEDGYFVVEWDIYSARFVMNGAGLTVDFDNFYSYEIEVVGNEFDDWELIE